MEALLNQVKCDRMSLLFKEDLITRDQKKVVR